MTESDYIVTGMTCEHCANSVTEEISRLGGVTSVKVDVASGRVTVVSEQPLADDAVRAAVVEAGYELAAS